MHVYYYKKKKNLNVLDSWHIYCFIVHSVCLFLSLLLKKKKKKKLNVLDSWHIYCFIVHFAYLFLSLLKKN